MDPPFVINAAYLTEPELDCELRVRGVPSTRGKLSVKTFTR